MECKLLPYKRRDILSAQELREQLGWGISAFKIPELWQVSAGEGVTIAVLDSGCDLDHPDLVGNLLPGVNIIEPGKAAEDRGEHGTHVTGIICAVANNGIGIAGVAPKAKVRPVKVLDESGNGTIEDVVKGIHWSIDQGVDFISMSLGCQKPIPSLRRAIKAAIKRDITIFVAGGNMGKSEHLLYPANYPETISVGAITKDLKRADFSNTGKNLDFVAPGVDILSTVPDNWYAILSGSSMAQPFVCGLAALLLSYKRNHDLTLQLNGPDDYRRVFKENTINVVDDKYAGDKFFQGFGIITLDHLFQKLGQP